MDLNAFHKFEHEFWESKALAYDSAFIGITSQTAIFLLESAQVTEGTKMLDVACGPGYAVGQALVKGAIATGLDFSSSMVMLAKRKFPDGDFHTGDAQNLPFKDNEFDSVISNFGVMHFPDPEKFFAEAFRVTKKSGHFSFAVWNNPQSEGALNIVINAIKTCGNFDVFLPQGPDFFKYSDPKTALASLQNAGFHNISSKDVTIRWERSSAKGMIKAYHDGGARIGGILRAQTPAALKDIQEFIEDKIRPYKEDGVFKIPVSVVMTTGQKP